MTEPDPRLYQRVMRWPLPRPIRIVMLFVSNWTFQMIVHMDPTERRIRLALEGILQGAWIAAALIAGWGWWALAGVAGLHTVHWLGNGHLFALAKTFGGVRTPRARMQAFVRHVIARVPGRAVERVDQYGSGVRGEWKATSDLDVIVVRRAGAAAAWRAYVYVWGLRWRALWLGFPLDIYLMDETARGHKVGRGERPVQLWP